MKYVSATDILSDFKKTVDSHFVNSLMKRKNLFFSYMYNAKDRLPMVHILVFYTGERPWNAANKLFIKSRLDINGCGMVGFIRIRGGA